MADYQGYLHWLDKATGELVARQRVAKFRVSNPPVAVQDTVVVLTDAGNLALSARRPHRSRKRLHICQARAPVVALIGRPNVGKSTLFNAMTGTRDALVADLPGLTRDRQYGFARRTEVPCIVVDTGGLVENADVIESLMIAQTERAIAEADRLIVVVDGRAGRDAAGPVRGAARAPQRQAGAAGGQQDRRVRSRHRRRRLSSTWARRAASDCGRS